MHRQRKQIEYALSQLWWLAPAALFAFVIGSTMLAAAVQSDAGFRLYGTPKYIGTKHLVLAASIIFVFAIGRRLAAVTGRIPQRTPAAADEVVRLWFWITCGLTLFGYAVWFGVGIKNGFSLGTFREFLTTDDPLLSASIRDDMFYSVQGVTTCTQFGVAAMPLGLWLYFRGARRLIWPLAMLVALAALRALLFSERLAFIELMLPAIVVAFRMTILGRPLKPAIRWALQLAPVLGITALVVFFGSFEYFRSWRYYHHEFDSYAQFTLWRVSGYYTTAHNNSALALETQSPNTLPYATVQSLWSMPGLAKSPLGYSQFTGADPVERRVQMLEQFGNLELNNEGGLFQPALDYGLGGLLLFWFGCGFVSGRLYRSYQAGTLAGVTMYPLVFLAILETPRYLYLCYARSLPAIVALLLVAALAARAPRRSRALAALPATA